MTPSESKLIDHVLLALDEANWQGTKIDLLMAVRRSDGPLALGIAKHARQCLIDAGHEVNECVRF